MAKLQKQMKKDVKKLSKQLYGKKGLTLKQNFDITTSFYANKKEKKPYVTLTAHGDYKISVVKLIVILVFMLSTLTLVVLCLRALFDRSRTKKRRRIAEDDFYDDYENDEELPF